MNNHGETVKIKEILQDYVDGTYQADTEKLKGVFHGRAVMNGYLGPECVLGTPDLFIADMASAPSMASRGDPYHAEIEMLRVEGDVAVAAVSETGFRGEGALVDFFQLIKTDGEWKIISKLFTTL